ncbi:centromere protein P [Tachysurus fulvidraco]|uniref:centromere protein P n=1 Tax=Tachysurus fulvidraco TaxID=1234273 RepID=UPI000F4E3F9D|nr:centromere protein P [Tachysurus fulvidraco]XP_047666600.1 centromere protein P [Tachysurus fulvidraco]
MENMEQKYEEEIQLLQQEIETCEAEQKECLRAISRQHGETVQNILKTISIQKDREDGGINKELSKLVSEISEMEKDLQRQTDISGISLSECWVKTLEKSSTKTVQQYRLAGLCWLLSFQVEFAVTEIQDGDTILKKVTDLNIISDGAEFKDLCGFQSRVEESKCVFLFFRTLRAFSERCKQRTCAFQHFKEKYPDLVQLPEGCRSEIMLIQNPQLPGCTMSIFWNITVSTEGVVKPKIDLLMKIPEQAQKLDTESVVESAPERFRSLLAVLGVEATIESLIQSVSF